MFLQKMFGSNKREKQIQQEKSKKNVIPKLSTYLIKRNQLYLHEKLTSKENFTSSHRAKFAYGPGVITTFVKILDVNEPELIKNFCNEAKSLRKLRHENLVNFIALVYDTSGPPIAVFEYCPGRTVYDHLLHNCISPLSWPVRLRIGLECAQALEYLHQNRIVYKFVCASNIILTDSDFSSKLTDFGLIRPKKEDPLPARWMAPEVLKRGHFSTQSDIWAYGIFLIELFTNCKKPYSNLLEPEVVSKLTDGSLYRMDVPPFIPEQLRDDIKKCWEETPEKRLGLQMIMKNIAKLNIPSE